MSDTAEKIIMDPGVAAASQTPSGDPPALPEDTTNTGKRICITLFSTAILCLGIVLLLYGWDYYTLSLLERPLSPKHLDLKPSGRISLRLGMAGFVLFILVYLYPLRKHWPFLARFGKTRNWFDYHVMLGLTAPAVVTFHSAFKLYGFAGMAYWAMIGLVVSGIVGRYFYAQIPRNISAAELSLKEMEDLQAALIGQLRTQRVLPLSKIEQLFRLPSVSDLQPVSWAGALFRMIVLDMARPFKIWKLRRQGMRATGASSLFGGVLRTGNAELERAILLVSAQAALSKKILFLSQTHRIFHGWHVIHRPFSISFALFVIIHVAVVTWLGYF